MPELTKQLIDELRAFHATGTMRQRDLAESLGLKSPQALAEILAGRNQPNAETVLRIQEFLKDKNHMPSLTEKLFPNKRKTPSGAAIAATEPKRNAGQAADDDMDILSGVPRSFGVAKDMILALQKKLAQSGAFHLGGSAAGVVSGTTLAAPSPVTKPAVANIANTPAPPAKPAEVKAPANLLAKTPVPALIVAWKKAIAEEKPQLAAELHREISSRSCGPDRSKPAPKLILPVTPKGLREYFDAKSTVELKALLSVAEDNVEKTALYRELKKRGE